jgi:hypothetical protein
MDVAHFKTFLKVIFDVKHIPDIIWEKAYEASLASDGSVDVDKFLLWYRDNMFTSVAFLMADKKTRENDDLIASVARKHCISRVEAGRIKWKFDEFDVDGSGEIEFGEFCQMMASLMGIVDLTDIPPDRMNRFWKEIDADQSGSVDFMEFTDWFLKYFPSDGQPGSVVESFYASYSPDVQRTRWLQPEYDAGDTNKQDVSLSLEQIQALQTSTSLRRSSLGLADLARSRRNRRLSTVFVRF